MSLRPAGFGTSPFSLSTKKSATKSKKKFDICDEILVQLRFIFKRKNKLINEKREKEFHNCRPYVLYYVKGYYYIQGNRLTISTSIIFIPLHYTTAMLPANRYRRPSSSNEICKVSLDASKNHLIVWESTDTIAESSNKTWCQNGGQNTSITRFDLICHPAFVLV